jgi:hypothetical protein
MGGEVFEYCRKTLSYQNFCQANENAEFSPNEQKKIACKIPFLATMLNWLVQLS